MSDIQRERQELEQFKEIILKEKHGLEKTKEDVQAVKNEAEERMAKLQVDEIEMEKKRVSLQNWERQLHSEREGLDKIWKEKEQPDQRKQELESKEVNLQREKCELEKTRLMKIKQVDVQVQTDVMYDMGKYQMILTLEELNKEQQALTYFIEDLLTQKITIERQLAEIKMSKNEFLLKEVTLQTATKNAADIELQLELQKQELEQTKDELEKTKLEILKGWDDLQAEITESREKEDTIRTELEKSKDVLNHIQHDIEKQKQIMKADLNGTFARELEDIEAEKKRIEDEKRMLQNMKYELQKSLVISKCYIRMCRKKDRAWRNGQSSLNKRGMN